MRSSNFEKLLNGAPSHCYPGSGGLKKWTLDKFAMQYDPVFQNHPGKVVLAVAGAAGRFIPVKSSIEIDRAYRQNSNIIIEILVVEPEFWEQVRSSKLVEEGRLRQEA